MRSPNWVRDELILALDLYFRHHPSAISKSHEEVLKLSALLKSLPLHDPGKYGETFRSPNAVYMKLANFQRLDPKYAVLACRKGASLRRRFGINLLVILLICVL